MGGEGEGGIAEAMRQNGHGILWYKIRYRDGGRESADEKYM
jgi:hypothetical protein